MTGAIVVLVVLVAATGFGLYRRATDGALKPVEIPADPTDALPLPGAPEGAGQAHQGDRLTAEDIGVALGERATLVQFSSAFCAPCRATKIVLDAEGLVRVRAAGAPRKADVIAALGTVV